MYLLIRVIERNWEVKFFGKREKAQDDMKKDFINVLKQSKYFDEIIQEDCYDIDNFELFAGEYGISKNDAFIDDVYGNNYDWKIIDIPTLFEEV